MALKKSRNRDERYVTERDADPGLCDPSDQGDIWNIWILFD